VALLLAAAVALGGCTSAGPESDRPAQQDRTTSDAATPSSLTADPVISRVDDAQWRRIVAAGVWRPGCPTGRASLRRLEVNHHTFDGSVVRGTLVVNKDVAPSVAEIFTDLFDADFPIRRMLPVENYGGDVNVSLAADNTSAFNCRRPDQINAPVQQSPHANGRAIDINPRENPWRDLRCDCWNPTNRTAARQAGPGKILKGGAVWRAFTSRGWIWQNIKVPDYMHFDTGFPSGPYEVSNRR
jgi:hypothetical protein